MAVVPAVGRFVPRGRAVQASARRRARLPCTEPGGLPTLRSVTPDPIPVGDRPPGVPGDVRDLAAELVDAFRTWESDPAPWSEERFRRLALRAFRLQVEHVAPYRRYCRSRGLAPDGVEDWRQIPPVPTAAFREVGLAAGDPAAAPLQFRTSGTTRGREDRGRHPVQLPAVYRASLEAGFRRFVLDDGGFPPGTGSASPTPEEALGEARVRLMSLVPPFRESDDSSLAWMVDAVRARFGAEGSLHAARREGIAWDRAAAWAEEAEAAGRPVCVLATTLALDDWTRRLEAAGRRVELPEGSRVMDTGGAKGREGLHREDVLERTEVTLGIPPGAVVNELGMTELLSQRYASTRDGRHHGPPWLRTRVLDPVTLESLDEGEEGVLCHLDLANVASVCAVLTEDLGSVRDGALTWRGRTPEAVPRGCSLATAELLAAQEATQDG